MLKQTTPAAFKTAVTYNAAVDHFDAPALAFWQRHGCRAVELACLRPGERVLDVGCGTGASALPAAKAVGPRGEVVGIDVAENMLQRAEAKAAALSLQNTRFRNADMTASGEPDGSFDAVISVFSIFFVANMECQVAELWRKLKPGGRLVVGVWGAPSLEPVATLFGQSLARIRPDLVTDTQRPWHRLTTPEGLERMLLGGGTAPPEIYQTPDRQPLNEPQDGWTLIMGSGFRGDVDRLSLNDAAVLKERITMRFAEDEVRFVETNGLHAVAWKR